MWEKLAVFKMHQERLLSLHPVYTRREPWTQPAWSPSLGKSLASRRHIQETHLTHTQMQSKPVNSFWMQPTPPSEKKCFKKKEFFQESSPHWCALVFRLCVCAVLIWQFVLLAKCSKCDKRESDEQTSLAVLRDSTKSCVWVQSDEERVREKWHNSHERWIYVQTIRIQIRGETMHKCVNTVLAQMKKSGTRDGCNTCILSRLLRGLYTAGWWISAQISRTTPAIPHIDRKSGCKTSFNLWQN